jgi:hypothetical protein
MVCRWADFVSLRVLFGRHHIQCDASGCEDQLWSNAPHLATSIDVGSVIAEVFFVMEGDMEKEELFLTM